MKTRILEKGSWFKIGDIDFYVAATEPDEYGKITSKSIIRLTYCIEKSDLIERINIVPLKRQDGMQSRLQIFEEVIKPFVRDNPEFYFHKN